jgi:protein arginine N-methyltransferase 1
VLDVGCGTGILSMFCVQAGAKLVYAVDYSDIITQAREIVEKNGMKDKIILIKGKAEEIELPEKVDIIISEWMGYFLFYESMLTSVLLCRDKFLKEDGIILPNKASLHFAFIEDADYKKDKIDWWDNVYGFDMSCIKKIAYREPLVDVVDSKAIVSECVKVYEIDLYTCTINDLDFKVDFEVTFLRDDYVHALIAWFDIEFSSCQYPVSFSTGPFSKYTHWKQTVFYLEDILTVDKNEVITGYLKSTRNRDHPRDLDVEILYNFEGGLSKLNKVQQYQIN